ncbi:MAG: hypothetical protein SWH78_12590 [Thermodesulfobacteriota bacterium]|nr:hypothetical protein [Thermodesulfobacteriota bacterium]
MNDIDVTSGAAKLAIEKKAICHLEVVVSNAILHATQNHLGFVFHRKKAN